MPRKRTTPPPTMNTQQTNMRRYNAFWGDDPPPQALVCIHSETDRFPWLLHCPGITCGDHCAMLTEQENE